MATAMIAETFDNFHLIAQSQSFTLEWNPYLWLKKKQNKVMNPGTPEFEVWHPPVIRT
jgi:hypothetical protein